MAAIVGGSKGEREGDLDGDFEIRMVAFVAVLVPEGKIEVDAVSERVEAYGLVDVDATIVVSEGVAARFMATRHRGKKNDRGFAEVLVPSEVLLDLEFLQIWHGQIEENDIRAEAAGSFEGVRGMIDLADLVMAGFFEALAEASSEGLVAVDDANTGRVCVHGHLKFEILGRVGQESLS